MIDFYYFFYDPTDENTNIVIDNYKDFSKLCRMVKDDIVCIPVPKSFFDKVKELLGGAK